MRRPAFPTILALGALAMLAALPAAATEVVYFTNGSEMPVVSHWVEGDMTHVDLGGNGFMAFPTSLIQKIDSDSKIPLRASSAPASRGRMVSGGREYQDTRPEPPQRLPLQIDDSIETDAHGMAVTTPLKGQGPAAERLKQYALPSQQPVAGMRQQGGFQGSMREGNHNVIDSGIRQPKPRVGVERRYGGK